jgi:hypothetical protein
MSSDGRIKVPQSSVAAAFGRLPPRSFHILHVYSSTTTTHINFLVISLPCLSVYSPPLSLTRRSHIFAIVMPTSVSSDEVDEVTLS